ncbi:MAG: type II secretion system protein GspG, partial [Omnitrophica bacterium]|nr:type II secretion system protein GspG [Candidatus Omnitrophota bacterium]
QALIDTSNPEADWNGPYMRLKEQDLEDGKYIDPWGNPYSYINPGTHNTSFYDIYSYGPNSQDEQGDGDDIHNW